ncbi:hypothetical protein [Carboxylicivirga sp. RSCT41]|uniref:hypothetical protein n=1 Tax=Carboxylicivirga agarovorans TaxID=3417570 RepID=UPI003D32C4BF
MKKRKKYQILIPYIAAIFFILSIFKFIHESKEHSRLNEEYFKSLNCYITGKVIKSEHYDLSKKGKIIVLRVSKSNIDIVDPRDSLKLFFVLKYYNIAVFEDNGDLCGIADYEVGDFVELDFEKRRIQCFDNNGILKFQKEGEEMGLTSEGFFPRQKINKVFGSYTGS